MKLLTPEELRGIDSTSKTIEKWDELLKSGLKNLGFRQSLIDGMYPYENGIPLMNGETLPVNEKTGRVFFKMSWADKLCASLSVIHNQGYRESYNQIFCIKYLLTCLWTNNLETFKKFFPDATEQEYRDLQKALYLSDLTTCYPSTSSVQSASDTSDVWNSLWSKFIDDSDIFYTNAHNPDNSSNAPLSKYLIDDQKQEIKTSRNDGVGERGSTLFIYNKTLEEEFSAFPKDRFVRALDNICAGYNPVSKFYNYSEVYLQDYLVISLNPIDKLMCSTKQAFSSCMSIAKQDDARGTNSTAALGLPAIFPTDAIYMIYMTPGKHKNMYWEEEEWRKSPTDRDKDKAYKYLKMTCRALTYKCTLRKDCTDYLKRFNIEDETQKRLFQERVNAIKPEQPRLLVGRQYSQKGEDYIWENLIEVLLARQGISTGLGYANAVNDLKSFITEEELSKPTSGNLSLSNFREISWLKSGILTDHKFICTDVYGYIRGIYYDNISITWSDEYNKAKAEMRSGNSSLSIDIEYPAMKVEDGAQHQVLTGSTRYGSHGVCNWAVSSTTDMFKLMMGTQKYTDMNYQAPICSECGEILVGRAFSIPNGNRICHNCVESLGYKMCPQCGDLYREKDAAEHEIYNIRELTNPHNYKELPEKLMCRSQLKACATGSRRSNTYLCAHCGNLELAYGIGEYSTTVDFKGLELHVVLCSSCRRKAVMCDKCKRVLFLESTADACLLLPNRRVVCPDCIGSIRLKQEKKEALKLLLQNKEKSDFCPEPATEGLTLKDVAGRAMEERGLRVGSLDTLIKDVDKQIQSYLQAHTDVDFPRLKSSNTPLSDEVEDIDVSIDVAGNIEVTI